MNWVEWRSKALLGSVVLSAAAAVGGCTVHEVDGPPPVAVYDQPPVVVYDEDYYYRGYYDGPYYIWVDRDGHYWHERREEHEFRERDRIEHDRNFQRAPERFNTPERQHSQPAPHRAPQHGPQYQQYGGRQGPPLEHGGGGSHEEHH